MGREEKGKEGDKGDLGEQKRVTELGREKKGEGGDRGKLARKRRVQRGREQSSQ